MTETASEVIKVLRSGVKKMVLDCVENVEVSTEIVKEKVEYDNFSERSYVF